MAVLDDIAAQRQRVADRLARVDAERIRLTEQLAELDAAERVLSRMAPGGLRRGRGARTSEPNAATTARPSRRVSREQTADATFGTNTPRRRGRRRARHAEATAPAASGRRAVRRGRNVRAKPEVPLGDATLRAVEALGNDASAEQVREHLGREFGIQVRPNHLGMALQRHRRAGRLQEDDGRWSFVPPVSAETTA